MIYGEIAILGQKNIKLDDVRARLCRRNIRTKYVFWAVLHIAAVRDDHRREAERFGSIGFHICDSPQSVGADNSHRALEYRVVDRHGIILGHKEYRETVSTERGDILGREEPGINDNSLDTCG